MGQEILYTSAPQGLRAGASGFCTVCSTAGMEPNLAEFLEGFSGYAHPFKPPDPRTKENPVNFSHVLWTIGGQKYNILSRVADAGLDYTGRTNLLAHHIALPRRDAERCPGGPAWVLAQDGFAISKWDGQLKTLPGQKPTTTEKPLEKCAAWERAAGDAGYAGVLAESVKDKGGRPVVVIYPSHCDTLALLSEALSLLPPEKRWSVTFATLYSRIYSSFECQWRFVFHESAEARAAKRDPQALVLDLTKGALPPARGGDLVKLAREGVRAAASAPVARSAPGAAVTPRSQRPGAPPPTPLDGDLRMLPPAAPTGDGVSLPSADPAINPFAKANSRRMSNMIPVAAAFFGGISLTLILFIFMLMNQKPAPVVATNVNNHENPPPKLNITRPPPQPLAEEEEPRKRRPKPLPETLPMPATNVEPEEPSEGTSLVVRPAATAVTNKTPERPILPNDPFEDIVEKQKLLLKLPPKGGGFSATQAATSGLLALVYVQSPLECELKLQGIEAAFGKQAAELIKVEATDKEQSRMWTVSRLPAGGGTSKSTLGTFKLEQQKLTFAWDPKVLPSARAESLRYCLLEVKVNGESKLCRLSPPISGDGIKLDKMPMVIYELPKADSGALPDPASLLLELQAYDFGGQVEHRPTIPTNVGHERVILVRGGNGNKGPLLQLTVSFVFDKDKERERKLIVKGVATYHAGDVTEEESLRDLGGALDLRLQGDRKKGWLDKVNSFDLQLRRAETKLGTKQRELEPQIKRLNKEIDEAERQMKGAKGAEKEILGASKRSRESDVKQMREELEELEQQAKGMTKNRDDAKAVAGLQQDVLDLMNQAMTKGRIEYRIYVQENESTIEIYRSKGFE